MGYCYDQHKRLCCDVCNTAGGVRKVRCPVNYCQAYACCQKPECKAKVKAIDHSGCRETVAKNAASLANLTNGREHLVLHAEVSNYTHPFAVFWRAKTWEHYSACCDLFRKTWLDQPDIAQLERLGNTIEYGIGPR